MAGVLVAGRSTEQPRPRTPFEFRTEVMCLSNNGLPAGDGLKHRRICCGQWRV